MTRSVDIEPEISFIRRSLGGGEKYREDRYVTPIHFGRVSLFSRFIFKPLTAH